MGRKGSWFSSVKKVFISSESKKEQKHQKYSKLTCFGYHHHENLEGEGAAIAVVPSLPPRKEREIKTPTKEAENEQNKQTFSFVLATAVAAGAAVAAAQSAAEAARVASESRFPEKTKEEISAIKIQTAFRGYLARRSLRAMRSLARLRTLVQGQSVQRQSATTLQCMQTLSRLQSQVRAQKIRMSEENQALQRQLQQKREKELDKLQANQEKWDDSAKSKEQIEAKMLKRQVAAMRRERALAYASTHQQTWKNSPKPANATFMDPNNPHWGWNWLERWMAARPWEGQTATYQNNDHPSAKSAAKHTMSVGEITKLYTLRDQNNSPATPKANLPRSHNNSPSTQSLKASPANNVNKAKKSTSPTKGSSWGGDGDSRSIFSSKTSENNRRHSIAVSPVRNDENLAISPSVQTNTKVANAKAKPKVQSPSVVNRNGAAVSAKKRLSLPAGTRRQSVPSKVGVMNTSNKSVVATIPEEKVKVRNGGGSR